MRFPKERAGTRVQNLLSSGPPLACKKTQNKVPPVILDFPKSIQQNDGLIFGWGSCFGIVLGGLKPKPKPRTPFGNGWAKGFGFGLGCEIDS